MQKAKDQSPLGKVALLVAFGLSGCNENGLSNQVEKCVKSQVKQQLEFVKELEAKNLERFGKDWKEKAKTCQDRPEKCPQTYMSEAAIEAGVRVLCLEAASGIKR